LKDHKNMKIHLFFFQFDHLRDDLEIPGTNVTAAKIPFRKPFFIACDQVRF
jgi:hypothetical protein